MKNTNNLTSVFAGVALALTAGIASADVVDINVDGVVSNGELGSEIVLTIDLNAELGTLPGGEVVIDAIGWDVTIEAFDPSWLSEAAVDLNGAVALAPGAGDDFPGTGSYSSGGLIDLTSVDDGMGGTLDLSFTAPDGLLVLTFFELFNDVSVEPDAVWNGTISVNATGQPIPTVPEPGILALLAIASLGVWAGRRRKA